jgi:hypothetical protein
MVKSEFPPVSDVAVYGEVPTSSGRMNDVGYAFGALAADWISVD